MLNYNILQDKQDNYSSDLDLLFDDAVKLIIETGMASSSLIQRRLKLGYARAARLLDQLETAGVIGEANGSHPREILIKTANEAWEHKPKPHIEQTEKTYEELLLKWNKTKYALDKIDDFEIDLGVDEKSKKVKFNLTKYGNLLVVGSQFTAVTDLLNNILVESMAKYSPEDLRIIAIDGVRGDLVIPNNACHMLTPLIVEPEKSISALKWTICEIEQRMKQERSKYFKVLILINSYSQLSCFSPSEIEDNFYRIISIGRKYGIYVVAGTDYPDSKTLKVITANSPAKLVFKPTDKKIARDTGIPESADLTSPNEAILETMFEGKTKLTIDILNPKEIYEEIFSNTEESKPNIANQNHYVEFKEGFQKMDNNELLVAFNQEVGKTGWVSARGDYLSALRKEFDDRGFDYSSIGDKSCLSINKKIKLVDKKIVPEV